MRSLRYGSVAACVALLALVCSAGASADVVCKAKEAPCTSANAWPKGTEFKATIKKATNFKFDGFRHYTCSVSTRTDVLTNNPVGIGKGFPATVALASEGFSGCFSAELGGTCTATTAGFPSSIKWLANSASAGDGLASSSGTTEPTTAASITLACPGVTCVWLFWEQLAHTYKGGTPAIEYLKAMYVRSSESNLFCGKEVIVEGEREITSPSSNPVYWSYG
jgi:hypothetical protein